MLFPQFDGDNPKLCLSRAKSHFEMYFVHPAVWVRVATHHFTHAAARWLQSIEHRLHNVTWETFSAMVWSTTVSAVTNMNFFFAKCSHIRMSSTVSDYIDRFTGLVEQLAAYTPHPDPLAHTARFIDGLRDDIRRVILVARPPDLDTACTLALLQEEACDQGRRREFRPSEGSMFPKTATIKGAFPLPSPPPRPLPHSPAADRHQARRPSTGRSLLHSSQLSQSSWPLRSMR